MNQTKSQTSIRSSEIAHINNDKDHYISVHECDRVCNFSVHYCLDGALAINEYITAANMHEAKEKAVEMMREYISKKASYWNLLESLINTEIGRSNV